MRQPRRRAVLNLATAAAVAATLPLAACGSERVSVAQSDPDYKGAELFAQRCSGCHTLSPAGTMGSDARNVRAEGPNLDQRVEGKSDVLWAIRNGGFTGSIMPQNIVTGRDADAVAAFVAKYAGQDEVTSARPGQGSAAP